ncbi:Crp/Fnr family transcriptional regulator [Guptibacillus hwajinpoensis]|uniref:CRP-like cAMP-binding protein n=1 Tax=Guptibacillus hwajinpoensis TaxID=208199 RepID=A0ABU0JY77_9BACL|nr:cyclic nucleotide-binding domain-containing protein [Alkalihalobacillus hemicentroti]MDQ0481118.1 CRP-like cAMP-binding protein [Alkalihalobacillus hemicentroti]
MNEKTDQIHIDEYIRTYQLQTIFNEELRTHFSLYTFEQGERICDQGNPAKHLFILVKGKVKIYTTSVEGKTLILSFKTPIELIGDIEYVHGGNLINTVEAVSTVELIGIPYTTLRKYGAEDPALLQFLLSIITNKFYIKSNALSFNIMHSVEVRLASYLLSVTGNKEAAEKETKVNLMDAANLIGTSYRHLNRIIKKFCEKGLIDRRDGGLLVQDRKGLEDLVGQNIYE